MTRSDFEGPFRNEQVINKELINYLGTQSN